MHSYFLVCVQDQAKNRPTMLDVVSFLSNEAIILADPKPPAFFTNTISKKPGLLTKKQQRGKQENSKVQVKKPIHIVFDIDKSLGILTH